MTKQFLVLVKMECDDESVSFVWLREKVRDRLSDVPDVRTVTVAVRPLDEPPRRLKLTDRQMEIYCWIAEYVSKHGYGPTVREIGVAHKINSPNGVVIHLKALSKKGWISTNKGEARTISLLQQPCILMPLEN